MKLVQRLSVAVQHGNSAAVLGTMDHDAATNFGGYRRSQPQRKVVLCMCMSFISPFTLILGVIIAVR